MSPTNKDESPGLDPFKNSASKALNKHVKDINLASTKRSGASEKKSSAMRIEEKDTTPSGMREASRMNGHQESGDHRASHDDDNKKGL